MKKTLLCFLFLFSTVFYAQVNDIVHCSGDNNFDLSKQKIDLIGNLDPIQTTVSYHLSLADASNNLNALANPSNYNTAASSTTIYARIDNNGTITTNYFNLIVNPVLTADTTIKYVNCVPTIIITGNGGNSNYEYSHAGVIFTQNNVITNPSPGSQTVYVRDGNSCVASKSLVVESLSPLSWIANKMDPVSCQGSNDGIIQITGSGGKAPYLYSIGNDNEFTASNIFKNLDVGNYTLKIQDSTGCIISFSLNITQRYPSIAVAVVTTNDSNSTNEGKIDLIVSGGTAPFTYSLKDSNEILIPSKITNPFTGLAVGSYEAIVTDSNGCTSSQKGINILNVSTPLTATAGVTPITCVITTGTITITPNGGVLPYQYSIDNGNTYTNSNVFPNLATGTYNIKVHDDEGTEVSIATTVEPVNLPFITTTVTNLLCNGASNGRIIVGAGGGKSPNVFSINGGPYTSYNVFDNLPAGTYLATAKDSNGCIVSESVVLSAPPPITFNIKIKDKTVTVDATGGDAKNPNNYALDGGNYSTGTVFSNVSYGNHVIHVKTPNNCMSSTSIEVTVPLVSTVAVDKGTITITATGGTPPYNYSLKDPSGMPIITAQSNNIFTEVVNGSYMVVVTDSKANTSVQANINISESSLFTGTTLINPITCINPRGIITLTATGGKSPYQYSLDYGLHYTTSNVFSDLTAGSYTITVRDSRNYMTAVSATVTAAKPVLVSAEIISDVSCNGGSDGRVRANVIQGQSPYVYLLDGKESQVNNTFNNLYSGVHTIKVTDDNNCTANLSFTISEPTAPLNSTIAVNNKTVTAPTTGGTPPYTYSLYDNIGLVTGPQTSDSFDNLPIGLYNLQIIDAKGCAFLQNGINISELPLLSATATITPITCNNSTGTITVSVTGGIEPYKYSVDNGINYVSSNVFTGLTPGTYNISILDADNNTTSIVAVITSVNPPAISATVNSNVLCKGDNTGSITAVATGGQAPYTYSLDGITFNTTNVFTNLHVGTFNITVKDNNGCTAETTIVLTEPAEALSATAIFINDQGIIVNATGGTIPYQYSSDGSNYQASNVFPSLIPGNYIFRVRDSQGCVATVSATILPALNAAVAITKEIDCISNASIKVAVIGGQSPYTYSINGGAFQAINVFNNLTAGSYTVNVKDALNSTFNTSTITIAPPVPVNGVVLHTNTTSCSDASITFIAQQGQSPFYYSIDNGITYSSMNTFNNLQPGTYFAFIRDSKYCVSSPNIVTIDPVQTLVATATVTNVNCKGSNDGAITINASGGTAPYTYSIGNSYVVSNIFNNLSAGYYNVSVKDALGCIYTMVVTIVEPTILSMTAVSANSTTSADNDGTITVNTAGGVVPYTYAVTDNFGLPIIPSQTSNVFMGLKAGLYGVRVTDAKGCFYLQTNIAINKHNQLLATTAVTPTTCLNPVGTITVSVTGGVGPYQYSLDNGATYVSSNVFSNLVPGNYSITVRDTENTTTTVPDTIADIKPVFITATLVAAVSCNGASNGSIKATVIQAQAPYVYKLDNVDFYDSNAEYTFNNLPAGEHTIQVIDNNSCTSFVSITIPEPTILSSTVVVNDKTISVNTTGGVPPYSYTLQDNDTGATITGPQTSNVFTNLPTGVYSVQVIDSTICSLLKTGINISNSNGLSASFSVSSITCNNLTGIITVVATGGSGSYEYSLDNGINYTTSNIFTGLTPGTYNINVRDTENNTTTSMVAAITPVNAPAISATVNSNVLCKGDNTGSITAIVTGGQAPYTYSLDGITFNTTNVFTNLRVGTFNITVKETNGCTATTTIVLTEPAEALSATAILINDQGIIVNAKGGTAPYNYYLQNNNGIVVAGPQKDGIFTRLPIGRYSAQVTDANDCGYIHWSVDVVQAPALSATVQVDSIKCNVPGTITVNASGGFQPYYYSFDNGATYTNSNVYSSFKPGTYTVKVRDYQNTIFSIAAMITQGSVPVINITTTNINCKGEASGSITTNVTGGLAPYTYSLDKGSYINGSSNMAFANLYAGTHLIAVKDTNGCLTTTQVVISEPASALMTVTTVKNQTITINATGGTGNYRYAISPNLDKFSTNNIFSGLTPGSYIVNTSDVNGCYITMNALVDPPAPLINGQIKLTLEFKPGQTLADLIIDGQNIKWYINQNPLAGKTSRTSEIPLPLTTVIVEGTTYYASQTINGIESTERMAVTVKSSTLGTNDLVIKNFEYYPNPVKNVLTISNTSIIDEVTFISIKGETLLTKKINGLRSEIDLSNFSNGVYFLKVKTEGTEKTVKLIKE